MKNIKIGSYYLIARKNSDYHTFEANTVVQVISADTGFNLSGKNRNLPVFTVINPLDGERATVVEQELLARFNTNSVETLKKHFKKELESLDTIIECMKDLNKDDVTVMEFMTWSLNKINTKVGATINQKNAALQKFIDAL